jgi:hypothetical protein
VLSSGAMLTNARPLIVLAGRIHRDGQALLAQEAEVVVAEDLSEAVVVSLAREAQGLLLRARPRCTPSLLAGRRVARFAG